MEKNTHIREAGFTLVELLVSLSLLGMMMMILYGTLNFSAISLDKNIKSVTQNNNAYEVQSFLRNTISNIVPDLNSIRGSDNRINFNTILEKDGVQGKYNIALSESNGDLVFEWQRSETGFRNDFLPNDKSQGTVILMSDIEELNFLYASANVAETGSWQPIWSNSEDIPKYVKIAIKSEKFWPEAIFQTAVSHTIDCWYDAVSRSCQRR